MVDLSTFRGGFRHNSDKCFNAMMRNFALVNNFKDLKVMKKTITFLSWMFIVLLASVSFTSCDPDDPDPVPEPTTSVVTNPYAYTTWEYTDIYNDGTMIQRLRFADETNVYYELEMRNAGGVIMENTSIPYVYSYSGSFIVFKPQQTGKANLEGRVTDNIKLELTNTSSNSNIGTFYKK